MNRAVKLSRALIIVVLGFAQASVTAQENKPGNKTPGITPEKLDRLVQPYLDNKIVNALSIAVVDGDKSMTRHFGTLSKESDEKPNDKTIYEIGSVSKVFTGILLADAVESGRVQLNDPIGKLMAELQTTNKEVGDSIQLRHLSTHVSGLPRIPDNLRPADPTNPYADYDRKLLTQFMSGVKPKRKPGEVGEYSNLAVGLLGDLLSAEAGVSYGDLIKQRIATPLGMSDTTVEFSEEQKKRLAPPHDMDLNENHIWDFDALAGAGAIRSTIADMMKFVHANLKHPENEAGKALALAWKQQMPARGEAFAMALGWHIARDGSTRWHTGQTGGYHSMIMVDPRSNQGVVILCNTGTGEVDALAQSILAVMHGAPVMPRNFNKDKGKPSEKLARLEGEYQLVPNFVLTVRGNGDKLFVKATGQPEMQVHRESDTKWNYKVVDAKLTFELPEEGKATAVTLHQNGQNIRGARLKE